LFFRQFSLLFVLGNYSGKLLNSLNEWSLEALIGAEIREIPCSFPCCQGILTETGS
jgi:hypothetical protein